eukprot:Gb_00777 [translate_table: standard]
MFEDSQWRAKAPLQLVHTDLCAPVRTQSIGNANYFMLLIDDCSRKTWVYFLKENLEDFKFFTEFKTMIENESGYRIQRLRSDNGGEFISNEFKDFCKKNGIRRQLTTPYTPQQNGVVERKNRTVMEMARCIRNSKNLAKEFWAKEVNKTVYLRNKSPTKVVYGITPEEAWIGANPNIYHLCIVG